MLGLTGAIETKAAEPTTMKEEGLSEPDVDERRHAMRGNYTVFGRIQISMKNPVEHKAGQDALLFTN